MDLPLPRVAAATGTPGDGGPAVTRSPPAEEARAVAVSRGHTPESRPPVGAEPLRAAAAPSPLLVSAQSIALPQGPLPALGELVEALERRALRSAGLVRAAQATTTAECAALLVGLWTSLADLRAFVLDSGTDVRAWRARTGLTPVCERALWWTRGSALPEPEHARARLARLRTRGPQVHAFTLRSPLPPPH
ncbi:DUF3291 domain-containing protein [Thermobifida halotolerans]|uniref:DUF3291 domain-containing protein n=1 Tax=Thermobifida halotolerans TaxID=483545 RepID=A0AA97LYR5_9ACTN|nr:DUF3291 domain-containing protein [Thermobifida halotolerans]UOE20722.1 DUF3291 domain-containing protein [Thermobifida halotolerans]